MLSRSRRPVELVESKKSPRHLRGLFTVKSRRLCCLVKVIRCSLGEEFLDHTE